MTAALCTLPLLLLGAAIGEALSRWAARGERAEARRLGLPDDR